MMRQAIDATYDDPARAETLLKRALELEPDAPDLLNNLAAVYSYQRREAEANTIIHAVLRSTPTTSLPATNEAKLLLPAGKIDQAQELVQPLLKQQRYHISEFGALAAAQIEVCLARKEKEARAHGMKSLQGVDPESVYLEVYYDRCMGAESCPGCRLN